MVSIFLLQYRFISSLQTHYFFCERENKSFFFLWNKTYNASRLQSYHCSCSRVYMKQHRCSCCRVESRSIFSYDICLQKCQLFDSPTVLEVIIEPNSKGSSFLLLSTPIYQAHWNDKCKTESSCCPWAGKKWSGHLKIRIRFVAGYDSYIW